MKNDILAYLIIFIVVATGTSLIQSTSEENKLLKGMAAEYEIRTENAENIMDVIEEVGVNCCETNRGCASGPAVNEEDCTTLLKGKYFEDKSCQGIKCE